MAVMTFFTRPLSPWDDLTNFTAWAATAPTTVSDGADGLAESPADRQVAGGTLFGIIAPAPAPTKVTDASSPMVINLDWDPSVSGAPAAFMTGVVAAARYLESQFTDAVTITINVGYDEVDGNSLGDDNLGDSLSDMATVSYADLVSAVAANARTATDASVLASLLAVSPMPNATYWVTTAQSKALGLAPANGTAVDGSIGFGVASMFTFGDTATSGTVASGTFDFFATAVHEMTEVMGRQLLTGITEAGTADSYTLLDLLHYSAPGTRDFTASTAGYFSPDAGITNLGAFNTIATGDSGDWASSVADDPFDAFASSGVLDEVSANDLTEMDAIGWEPAGSSGAISPLPAVIPSGVSVSVLTSNLASVQVRAGLKAGVALADFTQTGGLEGDAYHYTLGGASETSFTLTTAENVATLSVGAVDLTGAATGKLHALTMTANDQTLGTSSSAVPVNVVVGDNGNDVIDLVSISGIVTSAPTFIYALGGIDRIDATGMTGTDYFDSGAGADTMTGGSGTNVFEYGGAFDSTASAMDIITNFNVALDLIDLTAVGVSFGSVASLASGATSIAAGAIGWQTSAGNTFVYVDTDNRPEALNAANMQIELQGTIALTAANFAHL
jgi:hypothetical protein